MSVVITKYTKVLLRPLLAEYKWFRRWHGGYWSKMVPFAEERWPIKESTPNGKWVP